MKNLHKTRIVESSPVPGGPYSNIPLNGRLLPVNSWGNLVGMMTVSFRLSFAFSSPATSSHLTFGFSVTIAPLRAPRNFAFSASASSSPAPVVPVHLGLLVQIIAKLLGAFHVTLDPFDDQPLLGFVLLVLQTDGEAAQGVAVEGQGLVVVAVIVCRYGAGDDVNGVGDECVLHLGEMDLLKPLFCPAHETFTL